jgi:hypothetical protein
MYSPAGSHAAARLGPFWLFFFVATLGCFALIFLASLFDRDTRNRALRFMYYNENDWLSQPVPALGLVWSSLGAYLLAASYFQWHTSFDALMLHTCGIAVVASFVLYFVLFIRHEYLSDSTASEDSQPDQDNVQ